MYLRTSFRNFPIATGFRNAPLHSRPGVGIWKSNSGRFALTTTHRQFTSSTPQQPPKQDSSASGASTENPSTQQPSETPKSYIAQAWAEEREESKKQWQEDKRRHGSDDSWHPSAWVRARSLR